MLFWLLKDALLACKRCPFEVLLTPFWSLIKHLLLCDFAIDWYAVSYKDFQKGCFWVFLGVFSPLLCKENSKRKCDTPLLFCLLPSPLLFLLSTLCPFLLCLFNKHIIAPISFVITPSVIMSFCLFNKHIMAPILLLLCLFNKHIMSSVIMSSPIILSSVLLSWFANMNYFRYLCLQNKRKNKWQQ